MYLQAPYFGQWGNTQGTSTFKGTPLRPLRPFTKVTPGCAGSDIDLFLVGLDEEAAIAKIDQIAQALRPNLHGIGDLQLPLKYHILIFFFDFSSYQLCRYFRQVTNNQAFMAGILGCCVWQEFPSQARPSDLEALQESCRCTRCIQHVWVR